MTIGGSPYQQPLKPARARRALVYLGLTLFAAAIPLTPASATLAEVIAFVGGLSFAYGLLSSHYPWLGLFGASLLATCSLLVGRWLFDE